MCGCGRGWLAWAHNHGACMRSSITQQWSVTVPSLWLGGGLGRRRRKRKEIIHLPLSAAQAVANMFSGVAVWLACGCVRLNIYSIPSAPCSALYFSSDEWRGGVTFWGVASSGGLAFCVHAGGSYLCGYAPNLVFPSRETCVKHEEKFCFSEVRLLSFCCYSTMYVEERRRRTSRHHICASFGLHHCISLQENYVGEKGICEHSVPIYYLIQASMCPLGVLYCVEEKFWKSKGKRRQTPPTGSLYCDMMETWGKPGTFKHDSDIVSYYPYSCLISSDGSVSVVVDRIGRTNAFSVSSFSTCQ